MATRELRQHLRIKAEGKAIVLAPDGARVRCTLHDMSLGGAYLIRSTEFGPPATITLHEVLQVTMYDPHHGGSYQMTAEVVRVEALDGPGFAVRWQHQTDTVHAFEDHIEWEAEVQHVPRAALSVPIMQYPKSRLGAAKRITKAVVPISILGVVLGFMVVGATWFKTLMNSG
jgi:hypothetical protein